MIISLAVEDFVSPPKKTFYECSRIFSLLKVDVDDWVCFLISLRFLSASDLNDISFLFCINLDCKQTGLFLLIGQKRLFDCR